MAEAVAVMGGIDVCVDIIGEAHWAAATEVEEEDWNWELNYNLTQVLFLYQAVSRRMIEQGSGGSLAAGASVDGLVPSPYHAAYGAAKAGLVSITKTLAEELGPHGIRVTPWRQATSGTRFGTRPTSPEGATPPTRWLRRVPSISGTRRSSCPPTSRPASPARCWSPTAAGPSARHGSSRLAQSQGGLVEPRGRRCLPGGLRRTL